MPVVGVAGGLGMNGLVNEEEESETASEGAGSGSEDDEDEQPSLTRQLAETAVSVREMSKQLGESSCWADSREDGELILLDRSSSRRLPHPVRDDHHESSGQPPHSAHARAGALADADASQRQGSWTCRVRPSSLSPSQLFANPHSFPATSTRNSASPNASTPKVSNATTLPSSALSLDATLAPPPRSPSPDQQCSTRHPSEANG